MCGSTPKAPSENTTSSTKSGYLEYTSGTNTVWVKDDGTLPTTITNAALTVTAPATGNAPVTTAPAGGTGYTCSAVSWSPNDNPFQGGKQYTASVTLTAASGYTFPAGFTANINGNTATVTGVPDSTVTVSYQFAATAAGGTNVCQIVGGTGYATFAEAVAASASGDTIQMLSSSSETTPVNIGAKNLTINLNIYTLSISVAGSNSALTTSGDLTVNGGTGSALTLRGAGTGYGINAGGSTQTFIFNLTGSTTVTGGTGGGRGISASGTLTITNNGAGAVNINGGGAYGGANGYGISCARDLTIDGTGSGLVTITGVGTGEGIYASGGGTTDQTITFNRTVATTVTGGNGSPGGPGITKDSINAALTITNSGTGMVTFQGGAPNGYGINVSGQLTLNNGPFTVQGGTSGAGIYAASTYNTAPQTFTFNLNAPTTISGGTSGNGINSTGTKVLTINNIGSTLTITGGGAGAQITGSLTITGDKAVEILAGGPSYAGIIFQSSATPTLTVSNTAGVTATGNGSGSGVNFSYTGADNSLTVNSGAVLTAIGGATGGSGINAGGDLTVGGAGAINATGSGSGAGIANSYANASLNLRDSVTVNAKGGTTGKGLSLSGTGKANLFDAGQTLVVTNNSGNAETVPLAKSTGYNWSVTGDATPPADISANDTTCTVLTTGAKTATIKLVAAVSTPSITVTSTGLTGLKVGQTVSGSITYTLTNGTYAATINSGNFAVSNLPAGLSIGTTTRTSNTVVTVTITGTPTTYNASTTTVTLPTSIPQANVTGAAGPITPTGTVTASAVAKGDGAAVSGPPTVNGTPTASSITVNAVTVPTNPGSQTVEYAISTTSGTTPTSGWQASTTFSPLTASTTYYIYARTAANTDYNAGAAQESAGIATANSAAAQAVADAVNNFTYYTGTKTLSATVNGSTVIVTGEVANAYGALSLNIPYGVTVEWHANMHSGNSSLLSLTGRGTFVMMGGKLDTISTCVGVNLTGLTIIIENGEISSESMSALTVNQFGDFTPCTIIINGGIIKSSSGRDTYPTIGIGQDIRYRNTLIINGGEVHAYNPPLYPTNNFGVAIRGPYSNVIMNGGKVNSEGSYAISFINPVTDAINYGVLYRDPDHSELIGGVNLGTNGVMVSRTKTTDTYIQDTSTDLTVLPIGATAVWRYPDSIKCSYSSGGYTNSGAVTIPGVTVLVPVSYIGNVITSATAGTPRTLTGTAYPVEATNKTPVIWSVKDAGGTGATITNNVLNATTAGTVVATATVPNGLITSDFMQDFNITIFGGTPATNVTFTAAQTGGTSGTADSTGIVLTFSQPVTGLTAGNITITNGTGAVTKGTLTGSGTTWTIGLASVTTQGTVTVSVADFGTFHVTNSPQSVTVYKNTTPATYTATLTVNKDGAAWSGHSKTFTLRQSGATKYTGSGANGTVMFSDVANGTYNVYDGTADTGATITFNNTTGTATLNYYTVSYSVVNAGAASGSAISASYNGSPVTNGAVVLGGKSLTVIATGAGASSYSYAWSGTATGTNATYSTTVNAAVNAVCTATGTSTGVTVTGIAIKTQPTKLTYTAGETLNLSGLEVTLSLSDSNTEDVTYANFGVRGITVNYTGGGAATQGDTLTVAAHNVKTLTLTCNSHTAQTNALTVNAAATTYTVAVNGSYASTTGSGSYATNSTVTIYAGSRSNYTFTGWTSSDGVTFANSNSAMTTFTMPAKNVTVTANWSYNDNGGSGGGGNGGGGDYTPPPSYTVSVGKQPDMPTTATISITGTVDANDNLTFTVTDAMMKDAIEKAQTEAKRLGKEADGIVIEIKVTTANGVKTMTAKVDQTALDRLNTAGAGMSINSSIFRFTLDSAAVKELNTQAKNGITFTATPVTKLSDTAKAAIGNRPVFDFTAKDGNGKFITSYGKGTITRGIKYTAVSDEKTGSLFIVKVVDDKVQWIDKSSYDNGWVIWSGDSNSVYGVGYKTPAPSFTDTTGHWAKNDIDFVFSRGLITGTSTTTFSPNTAITRATFLTALGKLSGADVSGYKTSSFTDVPATNPAMPYIEWAVQNQIVTGIGNGKFAPDSVITREQMAVMMVNYAKATSYTLPVSRQAVTFADDAKISSWAADAVRAIQQAGIMSGKNSNLFDPQGNATWAEAATILRRFVELVIDEGTARGWVQNDAGQWQYINTYGKAVTGWLNITDGDKYWFDDKGIMMAGKWVEISGKWYYFYADGKLAVNATIDGYEVGADGGV